MYGPFLTYQGIISQVHSFLDLKTYAERGHRGSLSEGMETIPRLAKWIVVVSMYMLHVCKEDDCRDFFQNFYHLYMQVLSLSFLIFLDLCRLFGLRMWSQKLTSTLG